MNGFVHYEHVILIDLFVVIVVVVVFFLGGGLGEYKLEIYLNGFKLVSVYHKSIKIGQMTTLNVIFHVEVPDY